MITIPTIALNNPASDWAHNTGTASIQKFVSSTYALQDGSGPIVLRKKWGANSKNLSQMLEGLVSC